ncbi:MAG: beta-lactamase family protein [Acidimicrobiia bacterium]|nr:beta-lactamase family protein [Acidimicrobiia bacterium]
MSDKRPADIEADVRRRRRRLGLTVRMAQDAVPGLTWAAVVDAEPVWSRAHGVSCVDRTEPMAADTVLQACSLSKPVAALGMLSLVADGRVGLDQDVRPLLDYDVPRSRHYRGPDPDLTVRRLLTHRNGIAGRGTTPDKTGRFTKGGGGSVRFRGDTDRPIPSLEDFWAGYRGRAGVTITHPPDQQRSYSGLGYLVIEHLCEQLTRRPFASWIDERILGPIGMSASSFVLEPELGLPLACGHDAHAGELPGGREVCPWSAAAGLYATAGDLARFVACLVDRGRARDGVVVPADTVERMVTQGLGVTTTGRGASLRFHHTGSNKGFRTILRGYPGRRAGVVVLSNSGGVAAGGTVAAVAAAAGRAHRWPGAR